MGSIEIPSIDASAVAQSGSHSSGPNSVFSGTHRGRDGADGVFTDFFKQLYAYREYLKQSIQRDLSVKYKRSYLGYFWTMLHPLGMMLVISLVLSHVVRVPMRDYAVFFLAGVIAWNYFNSTAMMSLNNIRANARLFSQIAVPRYIFIISITLSNLVNLALATVPLICVMLVVGRPVSWTVLALPVVLLPLFIVTVGVSLVLAVSNVFFEDTLHLTEVAMQALYFMCPILYAREFLPAWLVQYLQLNPLFLQVEFFRGIFFDAQLPGMELYLFNLCSSLLVLFIGLAVFRRSEDKFLYFI